MTLNPRQYALIERVRDQGTMSIDALAVTLGVTLQTVRRDVQRLAEAGLIVRFHGGVRPASSTTENIAYRQRKALHSDAKTKIAQAIAQRVPNGCSLFINIGTTMEAVALALTEHKDLRVVTNNLHVALILSNAPGCQLFVAGGEMRSIDNGIVGDMTVDFVNQFKVDIGLIGISGIESDGSLRDFDYREVRVAKAIMAQSRQVWLAADSSKFLRAAIVQLGHLSDIDMLFTDAPLDANIAGLMNDAGVNYVVTNT